MEQEYIIDWTYQNKEWNTSGHDRDPSIDIDNDGNIYLAYSRRANGTTNNYNINGISGINEGESDIVVVKIAPDGRTIWAKQDPKWNTSLHDEKPNIVVDRNNGFIYIVFQSNGTIHPNNNNRGENDIVLTKITTDGNEVWTRQLREWNTNKWDILSKVALGSDGHIYFAFQSPGIVDGDDTISDGGADIIIVKVIPDGRLAWVSQRTQWNTPESEGLVSIAVDNFDNIYLSYTTYGGGIDAGENKNNGNKSLDIVVLKVYYNNNTKMLDIKNVKQLSAWNSINDERNNTIIIDNNGDVYVSFYTLGNIGTNINRGGYDIAIMKLNNNLDKIWVEQRAEWNTNGNERDPCLIIDNSGNLYFTYNTNNKLYGDTNISAGGYDIAITKLDNSGNTIWTKQDPAWNTGEHDGTDGTDGITGIEASLKIDNIGNLYFAYQTIINGDNGIRITKLKKIQDYTETGGNTATDGNTGTESGGNTSTDGDTGPISTIISSEPTGIELNGYVNSFIAETSPGVYELTRDVSLNEIIPGYNNHWFILGPNEIFDGAGFTIDLSGETTEGLFAFKSINNFDSAPTIKNLGVLNGSLSVNYAGYIVRRNQKFFKVDSCYNTGAISRADSAGIVGGGAGWNGNCTVTNCYNTGAIATRAAGIIGSFSGNCTVTNCYNTGAISGNGAGGIACEYAGNKGNCTVTNCYNTGAISGNAAGGIAGKYAGNNGNCSVTNCYNTGAIYSENAGGIAGLRAGDNGNCTVTNCYNTGTIYSENAGGIAGGYAGNKGNCTVTNCYNTGAIYDWRAGDIAGSYPNISQFNTYGLTTGGGQNAINDISFLTIINIDNENKSILLNTLENSGIDTFLDRTMDVTHTGDASGIVIPLLDLYSGNNNDIQFNDRGFTIGWYGNQLREHTNIIESVDIYNNASDNETRTIKLISDNAKLYDDNMDEDIYYYTYDDDISFSILNKPVSIINDVITIESVVYPKNSIVELETPTRGTTIYLRSFGSEYIHIVDTETGGNTGTDGNTGTETGGNTGTDGNTGTETGGNTGTNGDTATETGGNTETDGNTGTENGGNTATDGNTGTESGGNTSTDGNTATETDGNTETDGDTGTENGGNTSTDGDTGTETGGNTGTDGNTGSETGGNTETDGNTGTENGGNTGTVTDGDTGTETGGNTGTDGDTGTETGGNTGTDGDTGTETGGNTGTDGNTGTETGGNTGTDGDTGTDGNTGTETGGNTGTNGNTGTDGNTGSENGGNTGANNEKIIIDIAVLSLRLVPNTKNIIHTDLPIYEEPFIIENKYEINEHFNGDNNDNTNINININTEQDNDYEKICKKISLHNFYMGLKKYNIITKEGNIYKLTKNINLNHYFKNNDTFIELKKNEIFDGQNYSINYGSYKVSGLFSISNDVKSDDMHPIIRNLDIHGGFLYNYSGFIIRKFQKNYILDNCCVHSDNNSKYSGNIVGAYTGYNGSCIIRNCNSTGYIGLQNSGGIVGSYAGYMGICNIENCFSSGKIYNSAGIVSTYAGYKGICNISHCFSIGSFTSNNCSGITHTNTGSYGVCNIKACYSNSVITHNYCSGIVGNYSSVKGICNIYSCYHNNDNLIETSSGIIGCIYGNDEGNFYINDCFTNSKVHKFLFDNNAYNVVNEKNTYSDKSTMINNRGGVYNISILRDGIDRLNPLYYDKREFLGNNNNRPILRVNNSSPFQTLLKKNIFSTLFYNYQLNYDNKETYYDKTQNTIISGYIDNKVDTINYKFNEINNKTLYNIMNTTTKRIVIEDKLLIYRDFQERLFIKPLINNVYITPTKIFYTSGDNINVKFPNTLQKLNFIIN